MSSVTHKLLLSDMSDDELIKCYKQTKDVDCIGELYKRYTGFTFSICIKYLDDKEKSRDAVLEIFEELLEKLLIHDVSNFKSWLYSVTKNYCLLAFRNSKQHVSFIEDFLLHQNISDDNNYDIETQENNYKKLEKALSQLKEEQKKCVELFYIKNKSYIEITEITGYTIKDVKSYIQNGKRNLKNFMLNNDE